jgi:transposase
MLMASRTGCSRRWIHDRACPSTRCRSAAGKRDRRCCGEPADHGLGRSRGGLTTKIHLAAESRCRPLSMLVTAGQANDAPVVFEAVMDAISVPRRGRGRPRQRPRRVLADKAYSLRRIRQWLRSRGIIATIPVPADQRAHRRNRGSRGGRPPAFDPQANRQRNVAERCINRLKQWRCLAMRTDKLAVHYQAALTLAGILLWTKP